MDFGKPWIIEHSKEILETYGGDRITLRQLYYRLVSIGFPNNVKAYKRVVASTTSARWDGEIDFSAFVDRERGVYGRTESNEKDLADEVQTAKDMIGVWLRAYGLERWSNQPKFVEVWIEKKALQGVFERPCNLYDVALAPCKGYPSLTFLNEAANRFQDQIDKGKEIVILYFGDYDPSGEDIPRSVQENLARLGVDIEMKKISLNTEQIEKYNLPGVPAKQTDSRSAAWSGDDVVELDALDPKVLVKMCESAISEYFDIDLFKELKDLERKERIIYQKQLKDWVDRSMSDDDQDDDEA